MARLTFNTLTPEERTWLIQMSFNGDIPIEERNDRICKKFGIRPRTVWSWRRRLKDELLKNKNTFELEASQRNITPDKHYLVTWAQNATPVHAGLLANMKVYADHIGAEIHVIPGRYRNPSLMVGQGRLESQEWWDEEVRDYLLAARTELVPGVVLVGDVKIQPTAVNPLRSFEGLVGDRSAIFGHPKAHLQSMPHLPGRDAPIHATSLSCTVRNYSDTKAGAKGRHSHRMGFTVVEKGGHIRQITALPDGSFTDLYSRVSNGRVSTVSTCPAFVMGDLHLRQVDARLMESMYTFLSHVVPGNIILHDIFDGQSVNHHEAANPFSAAKRLRENNHFIEEEIEEVLTFLAAIMDFNPVLVFSNHCEWLDRHLANADWKRDIANADIFLKLASQKMSITHDKGILYDIIDHRLPGVKTLGPNDSFKVKGWELAAHGHLGVNGARGGMTAFRKFNTKLIFGHFHSTARFGDTVQVGTFTKSDMGYNKGPSSWCHAGAIIHEDGSVQQLIFKRGGNGEFAFSALEPQGN